jgi:hypothetical protein
VNERRGVLAGAAAACVVAVAYALGAAPTAYLLDSSELVASTVALSISHPPGHPTYHVLGFAPAQLPFGTAALRVHLQAGWAVALAVGLLPIAAARFGWVRDAASAVAAALLAVGIGFTQALLFQAIRGEVYALNLLFVAAAITILARPRGESLAARDAALAAAALGAALGNHHYLVLFTFPGILLAVLGMSSRGQRLKTLAWPSAIGAGSLLAYLALLARGAAQPGTGWGWPSSLSDLYWLVSAQAFQKTAGNATGLDLGAGVTNLVGVLAEQFSFALVLPAIGFALLALRDRLWAAVFGTLIAFNLATQTLFAFDPHNPDVLGYFMLSNWLLGLLTIYLFCGAFQGAEAPNGGVPRAAAVRMFAALAVAWLWMTPGAEDGAAERSLARVWDSDALRDALWLDPEPESLIVTAYFETNFNAWYGRAAEDRRPDVTHIHRGFRTYPFYDEMLLTTSPQAAPLLTPPAETGLLSVEGMRSWALSAPVLIETEVLFEPELLPSSLPYGLYLEVTPRVLPSGDYPADFVRSSHARLERLVAQLHQPRERQTARNLLWSSYNVGARLCQAGRDAVCLDMARWAAQIAPDDADVSALLEHAQQRADATVP